MATKIENLKTAKALMSEMHNSIERYNDCTRNFTGDTQTDLKIQERNIAESNEVWDRMMAITKALTSTAMKGGSEFDKAVKDAQEFIQELTA